MITSRWIKETETFEVAIAKTSGFVRKEQHLIRNAKFHRKNCASKIEETKHMVFVGCGQTAIIEVYLKKDMQKV